MPKMRKEMDLHIVLVGYLLKAKKECKKSAKQEIQDIYIDISTR